MPIVNLTSGGAPSAYRFSPVNLGQEPPAALPPDTSKLSQAQAHAALMGTVAKTISDLPSVLLGNYVKGRQVGLENEAMDLTSQALSGTPLTDTQRQALSGITYSPSGVSYAPPKGLTPLETREKEADVALKESHAKYYRDKLNGGTGNTIDNPLAAAFGSTATPGEATGKVTTYGNVGDPFGGPKAAASTKGAFGTALGDNSLAASPDVEAQLRSHGFKPGDKVQVQLDDGSTVDRIWDDRTAQDDPTGQWAVDDKGRKIPDGRGGFLPALRGRWDFHATGGKASPFVDRKVVGFTKPGATSPVEPSVPPNPSQPTGALVEAPGEPPAARPAPIQGVAVSGTPAMAGALAETNQDDSATEGGPVPVAAPAAPTPVATPAATPTEPEAMATAKGGKLVTEEGHAGGRVLEFPGFYREETNDGTIYLYPKQIKPGQKQFTVLKKPSGVAVPAQIKTEAIRMGVWKDGMSAEEASKGMEDKQIETGVIPPHLLPAAQSMARFVTGHPALKHIPTIREAKETVDSGLANQDTGGFGDMAIVEGFQRMVNPGATVRTQTMQQMMKGAGLAQYTDLGFLMDHFKEGDKFSPEVRARLKKLSEDIYSRTMKNAGPQMKGLKQVAKSYGITNPDAFIDNVLTIAPMYDAGGDVLPQDGAPGQPGASSPIANPATITAKKNAAIDVVKQKYESGQYTGDDKIRAKAALQKAGVPVNEPAAKPRKGSIEG